MRPSIMLLLRALLIMGSILAVMSCRHPLYAQFALNAGSDSCRFVPAAGGTFTNSGTGTCHTAIMSHSRREV